ncbi:SET domain-containing protein-lysine N-methyltransferase [Hydrocoleum sp. CS-953]|uniref:SET domain-containing protein-lysine N-methyltransferase n=1 Tax=Hydrocoleum sp. CS-953 TaxID=1671698 RepID=UPI00143D8E8D|nr:SET domain-containing protein-lysine N-methyltransferase [Hydrocoleum sp. CS-953]
MKESIGKGRGVFTEEEIPAGALVLVEPVLILSDFEQMESNALLDYLFQMGDLKGVSLGIGTFSNHSDNPNMQVKRLVDEERSEFYALRDIAIGEELTHKYVRKLWFSPA